MSRRDAIRWSRNQCICIAIGGAIAFVIELIGLAPIKHHNASLAMAAFITLFGAFAATEQHKMLHRTKS